MTFKETIHELYESFNRPLPGFEAHLELAPYRKKVELNIKKNNPKIASTLLLLYPNHNDIYFCLIERQTYKGTHSNQISFPGGKNEIGETIKDTALRECNEEIGVQIDEINIIGELTQVYVPPSNFLIHPFVGYCDFKPNFKPNTREVKSIVEIRVNDLYKSELIKKTKMSFGPKDQRFQVDVPYMDLNNKIVWGATSVILNEFRKMSKL
ncbi:MAG: CoA pyrophosphatase [Flavobacteriales bacterium]|nr:CoA pyrophosphatase [Flavobacteriales bacterium]